MTGSFNVYAMMTPFPPKNGSSTVASYLKNASNTSRACALSRNTATAHPQRERRIHERTHPESTWKETGVNFTLRSLGIVSVFGALLITQRSVLPAQAQSAYAAQTTVAKAPPTTPDGSDPYVWLEDKDGAKAMAWVKEQNAKTLPVLEGDSHYQALYASALQVAQSKGRIPYPRTIDGQIYNFWQDDQHVRGIWRRTTPASYVSSSPQWTTVLDLDAV